MNKNSFKPCPFCGSDAVFLYPFRGKDDGLFVQCSNCRANIYVFDSDAKSKKDVMARWNRRDYKESVNE